MEAFQAAVASATAAASAVTANSFTQKNYKNEATYNDFQVKRESLNSLEDEDVENRGRNKMGSDDPIWVATTIESLPSLHQTSPARDNILEEPEHVGADKTQQRQIGIKNIEEVKSSLTGQCPLCTGSFELNQALEEHLMNTHCVNRDGLERLLQLVDPTVWQHLPKKSNTYVDDISVTNELKINPMTGNTNIERSHDSDTTPISLNSTQSMTQSMATEGINRNGVVLCEQCSEPFKQEQELLQHVQNMDHFVVLPNGDHRCLAASHPTRPCYLLFRTQTAVVAHYRNAHISLVISDRHVYKYRCKHCSLAFKTQQKLSTHLLYHMMRNATKCTMCQRNFRSTKALQKHIGQSHNNRDYDKKHSPTLLKDSRHRPPALTNSDGD